MTEPLPWDQVSPVRHANFNLVAPYLEVLKENSQKRLATDKEFIWLGKDLERIQKRMDNPVVSLNEKQRRAEKTELDQQAAQQKRELAVQSKPPPKQYAITLRNADVNGLPEVMSMPQAPRPSAVANNSSAESHDEFEPEKDSARDIILEETERILADYVTLGSAPGRPGITVARLAPPPAKWSGF